MLGGVNLSVEWYQAGRRRGGLAPILSPKAVWPLHNDINCRTYFADTGVWTVLPGFPQIIRKE